MRFAGRNSHPLSTPGRGDGDQNAARAAGDAARANGPRRAAAARANPRHRKRRLTTPGAGYPVLSMRLPKRPVSLAEKSRPDDMPHQEAKSSGSLYWLAAVGHARDQARGIPTRRASERHASASAPGPRGSRSRETQVLLAE